MGRHPAGPMICHGSVTARLLFLWSCSALLAEAPWRELGLQDDEVRIVVEQVVVSSHEVGKRDTSTSDARHCATSMGERGLLHGEPLAWLAKLPALLGTEQSVLLDQATHICPTCGNLLKKNGHKAAEVPAGFSAHTLHSQQHRCSHPAWRGHSTSTIQALFGTQSQPDFALWPGDQGAWSSAREAAECPTPAQDGSIHIAGGPIPIPEQDRRGLSHLRGECQMATGAWAPPRRP